ncbi:MAG TPA: hypothetical protein VIN59_02110, partial [Alphaproteobacteria bacterium]
MKQARITSPMGHSTIQKIVEADAPGFSLAAFDEYTKQGMLHCTDCYAPVQFIPGSDYTRENGTHVKIPNHFRSLGQHNVGCHVHEDAHGAEDHREFRKAINERRPVLIHIGFDVGFAGLSKLFETVVKGETANGLWDKQLWSFEPEYKYHQPVRARDMTEILYYLRTAKELAGDAGLDLLWFGNNGAVQSYNRFVVKNDAKKVQTLVTELVERAAKKRDRLKRNEDARVTDTPRLFLFRVSHPQKIKARKERLSKIYAEKVFLDQPVKHSAIPGLVLRKPLSNQDIVREGNDFWVIGTPEVGRN